MLCKINIKKILIYLIFFFLIDFILSYFFFNLIFLNLEKTYQSDLQNRIHNKNYKYTFKSNTSFLSRYNDFLYTIDTNNFGFRDKKIRNININKNIVFFAGDSFLEGVGLDYKYSLIGHLDNYNNESNIYLNSGVSSYSPYLYKKKTITFLKNNKNLKVDRVIVLFDKSDPMDDQKYLSKPKFFKKEKNIEPYKKKLSEKLITFAFLKALGNFLDEKRRDFKYRYFISSKYNTSFFDLNQHQITAFKSIGNTRSVSNYFTDNLKWENKTKNFIINSLDNLKELEQFLSKKDIKFDIFIYPWPYELVDKKTRNNYLNFLNFVNKDYNLNIHNCYDFFLKNDVLTQLEFIGKSFLLGDVHYNSNGYKILANCIKDELK